MDIDLVSEEEFEDLYVDSEGEDDYFRLEQGDEDEFFGEYKQSEEGAFDEEEGYQEDEEEETEEIHPSAGDLEVELLTKTIRIKRNNVLDFGNVKDLVNFLSKVQLVWPEDLPFYNEEEYNANPKHINFPLTYYHCTQKEKAVLWHMENFRKQFMYKFESRRPLFVAPKNECDCQKLFPTYIQPTALGYIEFYECESCVQFLKDFFAPQFIEPVADLPVRVRSHASVIKDRLANPYEHSIIVVSLLIGAGFDAYVVDGYATKEITTLCSTQDYVDDFTEKEDYFGDMFDTPAVLQQTRVSSDEEKSDSEEEEELLHDQEIDALFQRDEDIIRPVSPTKYRLRFKKAFESKYEQEMQLREERKREEEERIQKEKEYQEWLAAQKPPTPDIMHGWRTHSWILVLPPKVKEEVKKDNRKLVKKVLSGGGDGPEEEELEVKDRDVKVLENEEEFEGEGYEFEELEGEGEEEFEVLEVEPELKRETEFGSEGEEEEEETEKPKPVPFFLEPFSGTKREITDPNFLGIEAVFNHRNYWANIQEKTDTCGGLKYDLEDCSSWAKLLYEPSTKKVVDESKPVSSFQDEEEEDVVVPEMFIDMPPSWTSDLRISEEDFKRKYPEGKKTIEYNDAIVELAAPYVNPDGLTRRVIKFAGKSRLPKNLVFIEERFENRKDRMDRRVWHRRGRIVHEYFGKGRKDALKEHIHVAGRNKPHFPRHLYYYSNSHPEGVYHRQVVHKGLVEHFEGREDFLSYRFTAFGGVLCRTIEKRFKNKTRTREYVEFLRGDTGRNRPKRKILGIVEKFQRNNSKDTDDDIAEKHMLIEEGKFRILFQYGDENFTRRQLEFFKSTRGFRKENVDFKPEDCIEFRVDPFTPRSTTYERYLILKDLLQDQVRSITRAREAEDEVYNTVTLRVQEDWKNDLELDYGAQSREEERVRKEFDAQEEEIDLSALDFASPYLEVFTPTNKEEEVALKQFILQNAKDRIIRQAEHIIRSYQEESARLKELLANPPNAKDETEAQNQGFTSYYDRVLCRMHIMEQRLVRLRAKAPGDYCSLLIKVLQHPLLNKYTLEEKRIKQQKLIEAMMPQEEEKKPEYKSCCKLDYVFKYVEKKKQVVEEVEARNTAELLASFLPPEPNPAPASSVHLKEKSSVAKVATQPPKLL